MKKFILFFAILVVFLPITVFATLTLDQMNQRVCDRFEMDLSKMAAIMEEVRERKGIKETRVAFGGIDTPIKSGDYWVNFAAEAVAFQRVQKYSSENGLRSSLEVLKGKVLKAKTEVGKAINEK